MENALNSMPTKYMADFRALREDLLLLQQLDT
jgi:hypothetical protein